MMEEDSFQRREGVSEMTFPMAIGPILLVVTYIVMFPETKTLCEVAS